MATQSQAGAKALGTTEILEDILSYLPLETIVKGQLVCTKWRAVIEKSPTLRKRRHLEADVGVFTDGRESHPLLMRLSNSTPIKSPWRCTLKHNVLLDMLSWRQGRWRDTFLTQPPTKEIRVGVMRVLSWDGSAGGKAFMIKDPKGINLTHLTTKLRSHFAMRPLESNTYVTLEEIPNDDAETVE